MKRYRNLLIILLTVFISSLLFSVYINSESKGVLKKEKAKEKEKGDDQSPMVINSDSLEVDNKNGKVLFKQNVVAKRGDIQIFAGEVEVSYEENKIKEIIARKDVKVVRGDVIATGQKASYDDARQMIILEGDPKIIQGDDTLEGERITFFLKDNKSVVEGNKGKRVQATIFPRKKEEKGKE